MNIKEQALFADYALLLSVAQTLQLIQCPEDPNKSRLLSVKENVRLMIDNCSETAQKEA